MKLDKVALGLAAGALFGAFFFALTLLSVLSGGGEHLGLLSRLFPWFRVSLFGALLGLVYGFVYGLAGGWLLAWMYNRITRG